MGLTPATADEILGRRHDFILHYYDMAVKDLERHLKIGWQTIAVVAGAIASISLGEQQNLPTFISISAALLVLYWGVQNVIDANYWALRAIGFLANVEAVYFAFSDKEKFNLYAGEHPPYQLMDSLRYQFNVCLVLIVVASIFYVYKIIIIAGDLERLTHLAMEANFFKLLVWQLPIFLSLLYLNSTLLTWSKRHQSYRSFVSGSPGPGMVSEPKYLRDVDFSDGPGGTDPNFRHPHQVQYYTLNGLNKSGRLATFVSLYTRQTMASLLLALLTIDLILTDPTLSLSR